MHSQHATSAAQDTLDALMCKYPPCPLAITSTEAMTNPLPDSNAVQDTTLPDAPTTTAPAAHFSSGFVFHFATNLPRALYCSGATAPGCPVSSSLPHPYFPH
jgi:hypothetical protein